MDGTVPKTAPAPAPTPGPHLLHAPGRRPSRIPPPRSPDLVSLLSAWQINSDQQNSVAELEGVWDGRTDESPSPRAASIVRNELWELPHLKASCFWGQREALLEGKCVASSVASSVALAEFETL